MVRNRMHNNISYSHIKIIQYSLLVASFSLLNTFTPFIIAEFVNNACILSPLNISFITINITIIETMAIANIKISNAK